MDSPVLLKNRYEIKNVLGRGGMGVVYQAFDTLMQRDVALKTLPGLANQVFIDLFYRECSVLAAMVHPNIVEIFDMGEFEDEGVLKPYFVMPLLPGRTLYDLIYPAAAPLAPERCADIVGQACRGLHAAHECGLLHRDLKPRNILVMRDDAVKLSDFGVVRLLGGQTHGGPGAFGTLNYLAPEQIARHELTARSDIFSLATVCYEALTAVHPFVRDTDTETAAAVAQHEPPLVSALNPLVSQPLAQVIAQAMAKEPAQRFESAAAFGDALQHAVRHERSALVLLNNPQNRLARARRSFARADYEFTGEILDQLAADGVNDPAIRELRAQVNDAARKRETELQLAAAQRYFQEEEYALALRRVADVLAASPFDPAALSLKNQIERKLNEQRAADSTARALEHLDLGEFGEARHILQDLMTRQPDHAEAKRLLAETSQRESAWPRERQAQQTLFESARQAYANGLLEVAYGSLKELMELTQRSKAAGARLPEYREFHRSVRAEYEVFEATLADARKLLANGDLAGAGFVTESLRERYENDDAVRALSDDLAARRLAREEQFREEIRQRAAQEPDLTNQLQIWNEAARARPSGDYFQAQAERVEAVLEQVAAQAKQAQLYEDSAKFDHALEEWLCVGDIYPAYPGLTEHWARVRGLWETQRTASFAALVSVIADACQKGDQQGAERLLSAAEAEFHGEARYAQLCGQVQAAAESHREVAAQLAEIQKAEGARDFSEIPALFEKVLTAGQEIHPLRVRIYAAMTEVALRVLPQDWKVARQLAEELARGAAVPPELSEAIRREEREEEVGNLKNACAASLLSLNSELAEATDHHILWNARARAKGLAAPFAQEPAIARLVNDIGEQVALFESAAEQLSRDHLDDCFALCDRALAAYPGHRLFLQLRGQAVERRRALGEDYFDRVERWLASEPDLSGRRQILKCAQAHFPFDARYAEELQHLERQQALAESLAVHAADFEDVPPQPLLNAAPAEAQFPKELTELERLASARRKEKLEAHERWFQQVEAAIANADYETASTMIRQAEQQQPERALRTLDQKLKEAVKKREAADMQFAEGKRLLANGEWLAGGKALYRAYELQPGDKEKTNSIVVLLQMQIRAHGMDNLVGCGELLSLLNRIQPGHVLPPDLSEALAKKQKAVDAGLQLARKLKDRIAALAKEAERARSKKALNSIADRIYESGQLNSTEPEIRRAAGGLLHKIELRLAEMEKRRPAHAHARTMTALAIAALVAVMVAAAVVLIFRLRERTVPVHVSVIPVKSGDSTPLKLNASLEPLTAPVRETDSLARVEIRGALPRTHISLDGDDIGTASTDGTFLLRVRPGAHTLDLSLKGFRSRTIKRDFARGETVLLMDAAVRLKPQSRLVP